MASFGINSTGFMPKRLADIRASLQQRLSQVQDPVSGEYLYVDLSDDSVISQMAGIVSEELALVWEAASAAYLQFDPLYNTGAGQSGTVQINGILRRAATATVLSVTLIGDPGTNIPAGSLVLTSDRLYQFATAEPVTIPEGGSQAVNATCTVKGAIVVADAAPMLVGTPAAGWSNVVCASTVVQGQAEETDAELRLRQQISTSSTAYRHIEAIFAAVLNVAGVTYCRAYQNSGLVEDANGLPAKSVAVVAVGGDDTEIAKALFLRVPVGMAYFGNTPVVLLDSQGHSYNIAFERPTEVALDVAVEVAAIDNDFPADTYADDIKAAIVAYAKSGPAGLGITQGFERDGFMPGETVYPSLLYTAVNSVPGLQIVSLKIAKHEEAVGTDPVAIAWNEVASFDAANITVTTA